VIKRHCDDGARIVDRFSPLPPRSWRSSAIITSAGRKAAIRSGSRASRSARESSIVGLADAWDAMTTNRPYKKMLSLEEARNEVEGCNGSQFRPDVVGPCSAPSTRIPRSSRRSRASRPEPSRRGQSRPRPANRSASSDPERVVRSPRRCLPWRDPLFARGPGLRRGVGGRGA